MGAFPKHCNCEFFHRPVSLAGRLSFPVLPYIRTNGTFQFIRVRSYYIGINKDLLRTHHKHGEQYDWILYYIFLSPQELKGTNEIIEAPRPHISNISYRTYYRKRHAIIETLSKILWGFTVKETIETLNNFSPED